MRRGVPLVDETPQVELDQRAQRWLGHHKPSFTLDTYVHLLDHRIDEPLDLDAELRVGTKVAREPTEIDGNPVDELRAGSGVPTHGMRSRR